MNANAIYKKESRKLSTGFEYLQFELPHDEEENKVFEKENQHSTWIWIFYVKLLRIVVPSCTGSDVVVLVALQNKPV